MAVATDEAKAAEKKKKYDDEVMYENIIGASSVLRRSVAAQLIMCDMRLYVEVMRGFLEEMYKAERQEAVSTVPGLFSKMYSLMRPLGIDTMRRVEKCLVTVPSVKVSTTEVYDC